MRPMLEPSKVYHCRTPSQSHAKQPLRSQTGSHLVEFAAGVFLLVAVAFLPLLDLAIVPIRWMMAQEFVNNYVRTLAMCESYSESRRALNSDPSLRTRLLRLGGVGVQDINLHLEITRVSRNPSKADSLEVHLPGCIPSSWLPDGALAPCMYLLKIDVQAFISPAILMNWPGPSIPGLTAPIPIRVAASHEWTNLGRDPSTEKYFINE
jgi:hypothetical protein